MLSGGSDSELAAARAVEHVTGRRLQPYDRCSECGSFHDRSGFTNGRYDFHQGEDGALEVTLSTSSSAEGNERNWNPYITSHPAPDVRGRWHVTVNSVARAKAPRSKKGARGSKGFLESVGPALAEFERRGVSNFSPADACWSYPFHDPACPYGTLHMAGVQFAFAEPGSDGPGSIAVSVLFGYDDMPSSAPAKPGSSRLGPVRWSFGPNFNARLESRRADDEQREAEIIRDLGAGRMSESEISERARRAVDERIRVARSTIWREQLSSRRGPTAADAGTGLIDLLDVEFSLHSDLAKKLLRADPRRVRREVFFWLTWARSSAWHRTIRLGRVPERAPQLPDAVTGVWVGYLPDRAQVLHWGADAGWTWHSLAGALPTSFCRR